jgi:WD40 repeat protein
VAFFADGKLKRISVDGGPTQTICDVAPQDTTGSWGADGTIVFHHYQTNVQGVVYQVNSSGGTPAPFIDRGEVYPLWLTFLPDSRTFLFLGQSSKRELEGIYAGTVGSKETKLIAQVPLTRVEYANGYLLYVRDGALIAHQFDANQLSLSGEPKILVPLVAYFDKTGFAEFSVSQTGNLVYLADVFVSKMAWLDRSGRELGKIGNPDRFVAARLSPDGKQVAASIADSQTGSGDLWIYDLNGGRSRFAFGPTDDSDPVWAPDGKRIAYFSGGPSPSTLRIKNVNDADGTGETPIEKGFIGATDWSRDGNYLLYVMNEPTVQRDMWVLPFDGSRKLFPFLQTQASEHGGKFSPDGKFVAFNSDESGTMEVYVAPFDKPTDKIRVSGSGGSGPRWNSNGRELFYVSADQTVMAVTFTPGAPPKVGSPQVLFPISELFDYDVAADGQRFLVVTGAGGLLSAAPVRVILNWQSLIRKK